MWGGVCSDAISKRKPFIMSFWHEAIELALFWVPTVVFCSGVPGSIPTVAYPFYITVATMVSNVISKRKRYIMSLWHEAIELALCSGFRRSFAVQGFPVRSPLSPTPTNAFRIFISSLTFQLLFSWHFSYLVNMVKFGGQ